MTLPEAVILKRFLTEDLVLRLGILLSFPLSRLCTLALAGGCRKWPEAPCGRACPLSPDAQCGAAYSDREGGLQEPPFQRALRLHIRQRAARRERHARTFLEDARARQRLRHYRRTG